MTIHHAFDRPRESNTAHTPKRELTAKDFPSEEPLRARAEAEMEHLRAEIGRMRCQLEQH